MPSKVCEPGKTAEEGQAKAEDDLFHAKPTSFLTREAQFAESAEPQEPDDGELEEWGEDPVPKKKAPGRPKKVPDPAESNEEPEPAPKSKKPKCDPQNEEAPKKNHKQRKQSKVMRRSRKQRSPPLVSARRRP